MERGWRLPSKVCCGAFSHVRSHLSPDSLRVGRSMSLYYTPNVHRPHPSRDDSEGDPPRDVPTNIRPRQRPPTVREDRLRQRQRETLLNDGTNASSIFIFPQPPGSTSPIQSNSDSSRPPYSEDSLISLPAHRRTATSRLSPISQSESLTDISLDVDGVSTPTTIATLSIGSPPFTDVGEDEGSVDDRRIEAMTWDWDDDADEGADGPGGELRRSRRSVRPDEVSQLGFARTWSQVRPYPLHHGSGEHLRVLLEREQSRNRLRDTSHFQYTQQPRSRSYSPLSTPSNAEIDLLSLAPQPRIRIPFLDFFVSILGVEESTMDLLTRCSTVETHGSILFPGHTIQPLPAPTSLSAMVDGEDDITPADQKASNRVVVHGFHKALLSPGIERDSWGSLKEGLTVFCTTAASVPTQNPGRLLGLTQLWGLVSHVYARGGKVIRGVYSSAPASPSGIEEAE